LLPCEPSRIDLEEFRGRQNGLPASAVARKECFLLKLDTKLVPQLLGIGLFQMPHFALKQSDSVAQVADPISCPFRLCGYRCDEHAIAPVNLLGSHMSIPRWNGDF